MVVAEPPAVDRRWLPRRPSLHQRAELALSIHSRHLGGDREAGKIDAAVKYLTAQSTSAIDRGQRIHGNIESILRRAMHAGKPTCRILLKMGGGRPQRA